MMRLALAVLTCSCLAILSCKPNTVSTGKAIPTDNDDKELVYEPNGKSRFVFPDPKEVTKQNLGEWVKKYAISVGAYLPSKDHAPDPSLVRDHWIYRERRVFNQEIFVAQKQAFQSNRSLVTTKRDHYCKAVDNATSRQRYIVGAEKAFGGKVNQTCDQYDNCGEAANAYYCMAHYAGYVGIMECLSRNDHVFTVHKNDNDQLCIMDRWNTENQESDNPYYFCGVEIKDGKVIMPDGTPAKNRRGQITCRDPLEGTIRPSKTATSESFDQVEDQINEQEAEVTCNCNVQCNYVWDGFCFNCNKSTNFGWNENNVNKRESRISVLDDHGRDWCRTNVPKGYKYDSTVPKKCSYVR